MGSKSFDFSHSPFLINYKTVNKRLIKEDEREIFRNFLCMPLKFGKRTLYFTFLKYFFV